MSGIRTSLCLLAIWTLTLEFRVSGLSRSKDYRASMPGSDEVAVSNKHDDSISTEPSCEELKAMWRFSKRQSRAAEITNEIPTYRDPFSYNVWESYYPRSRSIGGMRIGPRFRNRPVYGRVVHKPPSFRVQDVVERNRAFEEVAKMYGTINRGVESPRRRVTAFRLGGGGGLHGPVTITPQSGSFQHLKELIRTERARELQEQRMAEEVAARAAALKELSRGGNRDRHRHSQEINYMSHSGEEEDQRERERERQNERLTNSRLANAGIVAFPNLLAPAVRPEPAALYMEPDDPERQYRIASLARQRSALYQDSPYGDELDGELML